jgi:hypothetical protein
LSIDGTETLLGSNRVFRNGVAATFATPKVFPGTLGCFGNCQFRTLTFTPTSTNVTVTITGGTNGVNVFAAGYVDSFNPASLSTNYLGDAGLSTDNGITNMFQVVVPAGHVFVLVLGNTLPELTGTINYQVDPVVVTSIPTLSPPALCLLAILLAAGAAYCMPKAYGRGVEPRQVL